ncbi:MAG: hypothetical protein EBS64_05050 [Verrucomicrobia bacterium]|nr:hypothetical protein [Verrucomicrobiota bacterium]
MPKTSRQGVLAAGNFIVDYVKIIDGYPAQDMLASIVSESRSNGGGPYNVLKNLTAMKVEFPLAACGLVGDDTNGQWIKRDCQNHRIDVAQLHLSKEHPTSYEAPLQRPLGRPRDLGGYVQRDEPAVPRNRPERLAAYRPPGHQ